MNMILFILVTVLSVGGFVDSSDSNVAQAFKEYEIVPNIILQAPQDLIQVKYAAKVIYLGTEVFPDETLFKPKVAFNAKDDELYTLVFFGPDLPPDETPPYTQFLHWLIVNIPGKKIDDGDAVVPYFPPTPYPLFQYNYIFLLYKQNATIDSNELKPLSIIIGRPNFDVINFQEKYELTGPVAGNFMKEVYVPKLI